MEGLGPIAAAAAAFVGTHFLLSHPLRKPIVDTVGNAAFLGTYSAVAAATLGWLALAYRAAPAGALLWPVGDGLWATATAVMLLASILLMGSLVRNPALPNPGSPAQVPAAARGVYAVTRHPMMWSFALWGLSGGGQCYPRGRDHRSGAGWSGVARPQERGAPARHLARLGKKDQLLAVRRDRLRQGPARRVRHARGCRWPSSVARRNLGAHTARRLAGGHLALAVAEALRHTPTAARAHVSPLRRRSQSAQGASA